MSSISSISALASQTTNAAMQALSAPGTRPAFDPRAADPKAKAREAAVDFEAVFLNNMFTQMFTSMDGEGPMGGEGGGGVWRSFLTDEYSKSFARAGGVGLADQVYRTLLQQQEAGAPAPAPAPATAIQAAAPAVPLAAGPK